MTSASRTRSALKAVTWRVSASADTFLIGLVMTGKPKVAFTIAGLEVITKLVWYYLHERIWSHVPID